MSLITEHPNAESLTRVSSYKKKSLVTLAEGSRRHKEVGRRRVSPRDDESRSKETSESSELGQPSAF